ncbi:GNAT family N-acetyltransferase [Halobellus marinus]|jgi:ribosomal protein S18 acetylase RimI-like enzyme|uniref:GNAT family N-acetyltransferase n=1 Tax=Halobellus TaxID=1073986 RepID=UPI0028AE4839|nr:GNAT family N-acetyltransferase [Halobellus sp. DFY28]
MKPDTTHSTSIPRLLDGIRTLAARFRPRQITPTGAPFAATDADGREIEIRPYRDSDFAELVEMYDSFDPTQRAQGVPPLAIDGIRSWLSDVLDGVNVVASCDGRIVGHVGFVPDGTGRHELFVFVHQDYQQAGIGSHLLAGGMGQAQQDSVGYVWLTVEKTKRYQQRFYSRAGFSAVNPMGMTHRMSRTL